MVSFSFSNKKNKNLTENKKFSLKGTTSRLEQFLQEIF